jgi:hypothetical protein
MDAGVDAKKFDATRKDAYKQGVAYWSSVMKAK